MLTAAHTTALDSGCGMFVVIKVTSFFPTSSDWKVRYSSHPSSG